MTRGGRPKSQDASTRRCIVTRKTLPKAELIRFVVGPDGQLVPDLLARLPGRGMWISAHRAVLDKALDKRLFNRAAKAEIKVADRMSDDVEALLARRVVELIALARKAGEAVAGYEKVKSWLMTGQGVILVQASDGSARGKTKLRTPPGGAFVGCLSAGEIGLAFGRESVIHGAVTAGGLGDRIVEEATRLAGFRQTGGETDAGKELKDA
ncbi:MAG: RNA-binding protein [Brevirhabdus sp.]